MQNWHDGRGWVAWKGGTQKQLSKEERVALKKRIMRAQAERELEAFKREKAAVTKASAMWGFGDSADGHPYLARKMVGAHGLRQLEGLLLVPVRDTKGGWHGLQTIDADGGKKYLTGSRTHGCYYGFGKSNGELCVAEGFATAASIYESTGHPTAAAFDAGNLKPVACALRLVYPKAKIVLCADDDPVQKTGNAGVGIPKAREAAKAVGGFVAVPDFGVDKSIELTDFNDLFRLSGPWAVRACVERAEKVT